MKIPQPFLPVRAESRNNEHTVHVIGRDYTIGADGMLCSIRSQGVELLAAPVRLTAWRAPTDNDKRLIHVQPQNLIHREQPPAADTARFAVFRGVVGNAPGAELLGLTGHGNACFAGA